MEVDLFVARDCGCLESARRANSNRIRGPQSALTDFLAANNISAAQIRAEYERRRAESLQQQPDAGSVVVANNVDTTVETVQVVVKEEEEEGLVRGVSRKRKRKSDEAVEKVKKGKGKQPKKLRKVEDSDDEFDGLGLDMYRKVKPLPGQLENCDVCDKRFTVTPYTKEGPNGGLLCASCGKQSKSEDKKQQAKRRASLGKGRRKLESDRLDGIISHGSKSLQQLCIQKVMDHHNDIDEFGDLPEKILDRLAEIFAKRRVIDARTVKLFLRPDLETVAIHDCANLGVDDYKQIFAVVPNVRKLVLRNAGQFKDEVMAYMLEKAPKITHLQLYCANLISNEMWHSLMEQRARLLETLKLQWLDASFEDDAVLLLAKHARNLRRLKIKRCRRVGAAAIDAITGMKTLEHVSLQPSQDIPRELIIKLVNSLGPKLRTLSLEQFPEADDTVLAAIHSTCRQLSKLRLVDNDICTDAGFKALFTDWGNPSLTFVDLSSTRDVDNNNALGPAEPVGLASEGLKALMLHSGPNLDTLDIASCRHISHAAFMQVFSGEIIYPKLRALNITFCTSADTTVVAGIFRSCPRLVKLTAFGCFKVDDVVVPRGVAMIGLPRAQDAIEQFGDGVSDVKKAVAAMDALAGMVSVQA